MKIFCFPSSTPPSEDAPHLIKFLKSGDEFFIVYSGYIERGVIRISKKTFSRKDFLFLPYFYFSKNLILLLLDWGDNEIINISHLLNIHPPEIIGVHQFNCFVSGSGLEFWTKFITERIDADDTLDSMKLKLALFSS